MPRLLPCLALLVVLGLGCDQASRLFESDPAPAARGTLLVGKAADVIGLDPARITDTESVEVCEQIYEHLVAFRRDSTEIGPALATSWTVSDDGRVWTFQLRPGVRFHDGTPMNAAAVVFSLDRQRDASHPFHEPDFLYWQAQFKNIEKVEAQGELAVRITIDRPFAPLLSSLAMFPVSIVSPTAVAKGDLMQRPVGTGPFRFVSWTPGERVVLENNPDYWGPAPHLSRLVFRTIPDPRQRLVSLEGGAIDVAFAILPEELQYVQLHPDLTLHSIATQNVAYLAMNTQKPPFDNPAVRRAVNHAINKEPIVKLVYQGLAEPATGPLPPSVPGYKRVPGYSYDPTLARAELTAARALGQLNQRRYTLYVPSSPRPYLPDPEGVARVIQRNLSEVGLEVMIVVNDFRAHLAAVQRGEHDLCLLGWTSDNGDPDNFLYVLLDRDNTVPGLARNVAFYKNAQLHGILTVAQESSDQDERRLYEQAQDIIFRDAPWVPLAHSEISVSTRKDVANLAINPLNLVYYQDVWLDR